MSNLAIYAHRGVLTNAPENSMRAFEDAMKEAEGLMEGFTQGFKEEEE